MGSYIHLTVGRRDLDWGKNWGFTDHSPLFQQSDLALIPYCCYEEHPIRDAMSKPLGQVIDRLELLGFTLAHCEREFDLQQRDDERIHQMIGYELEHCSFDELKRRALSIDLAAISNEYRSTESAERGLGLGLTPYSILRLLALNPDAQDLPVTWQFADLERAGWAKRNEFVRPLNQSDRFLIVTEGSSDAKIIRHALRLLKPHIADFFDFVDMEEGYPLSGTGNLYRFLQGLISISIQNNVIVIFDNDAQGVDDYELSCELNVPANMRILRLPDSSDFSEFDTVGPNGRQKADINGRAAAIECYLDLSGRPPLVSWSSFTSKRDTTQGALLGKTAYMKRFLRQRERVEGYDYSRIQAVLNMIITSCSRMREAVRNEELLAWSEEEEAE